MTTYTTPHFATGASDSNLRSEPILDRARPASAAPYRTAGVSNEAELLAEARTPDWQPAASSRGVPKAAIGALGAALVGGVALAIVLMAPSNKATRPVMPDPVAQAAAQNAAAQKSVDSSDAAVNELDRNPSAAGNAAATDAAAAAQQGAAAATPAPVQSVTPTAPPVVNAPVARVPRHTPAPVATPRVAPQPAPDVRAPVVTPPADVQPPAMQQTPDTPTVTPSVPTPAPTPTPDTPAPAPAPTE